MKEYDLKAFVPGVFVATVLTLAVGAGAQTPPMADHHKDAATGAKHDAEMKAECQAMMAKKQKMHDKLQAMDAALDKLVAEMNTAMESNEVGAMDKAMGAAPLNQQESPVFSGR
jgi:Skp family chaperone for outer membrane proteins